MELGQEIEDRIIFKRIKRQRPGMCCNIVNIILVMVYPSKAGAPAKAVRD